MRLSAKTYSNLLDSIFTLEDSLLTQDELQLLSESLFSGNSDTYNEVIKREVRSLTAEAVTKDMAEAKLTPEVYLKKAKDMVASLPVLELAVAFEPSVRQTQQLVTKIRQLAGYPIIAGISVRPYLLGGTELTLNGEFRDYSLRTNVNHLFGEMFAGLDEEL